MLLETFQYTQKGWTKPFPDWDSEDTLVLIFASPNYIDNQTPLLEVANYYKNSKVIGCSSAGEICGTKILDETIVVAVIKLERSRLKITKVINQFAENSFETGKQIAENLDEKDLRGIFVLSEGLHVNGSELVKGLNTVHNQDIVITGGLAGDGNRFHETWGIYQNKIEKNLVVAVGFYGDHIFIGHGSRGGWDIFGPERRITRSKNNILYELDNRPALALYKEYLGERASGLPATGLLYPLAIRKNENDDKHLVRTILSVNEQDQSLTFAGDMPIGFLAQLMRANFDRLISAADEAGNVAINKLSVEKIPDQPILAIAISCVGRRLLLGERTEEETESTFKALPRGAQQIGFYSYGEISPYSSGNCDLHNQTMTLTTLVEE